MVLGSGPDRIGKTAELDRFASQALRYLRKQGHEPVWVDENGVSIAGAPHDAARVYLEPLILDRLAKIIEQEKPDCILYGFGGLLAVHLVVFMEREGFLERHGVKVLGTPLPSLNHILDAEIFKQKLTDLGVPVIEGATSRSDDACVRAGRSLGFPVLLKPSLALEGIGGYMAYNVEEVEDLAQLALNLSPVRQVEVERAPVDSVQLGIECLHDPGTPGNVHLIGTYEAMDGVGVHPGDSIVVAPSPTLKGPLMDKALHFAGLIGKAMDICGSFQIRFAFNPGNDALVVFGMELGPNRFSSLFTILHDMPLAEINAALALGGPLDVFKTALETNPPLSPGDDHPTVVRVPLFSEAYVGSGVVDTTMSSTGSMATLGPSLPAAFGKAADTIQRSPLFQRMKEKSRRVKRLATLIDASGQEEDEDHSQETLYRGINPAFLPLLGEPAASSSKPATKTADIRLESTGHSRYLYFSSGKKETRPKNTPEKDDPPLLLLGPGSCRTGPCAEADHALVRTALALKEAGQEILLLNNNPDAAGQDPGIMGQVCLEQTSLEAVETIVRNRPIKGVIHQFCLQVVDGLDGLLEQEGVKLFGTPYRSLAEMRHIPSLWEILSEIGIPLRPHRLSPNPGRAVKDAAGLGYPILALVTDAAMNPEADIIYSEAMLKAFLEQNKPHITAQAPLFIEAYEDGMTFFEIMAVCDGRDARTVAVLENIEEYGIHSGDCASTIPTLSVGSLHKAYAEDAVRRIVERFHVVGHLHMELAIKGRHVFVTAARPFPSRNLPFVEKTLGLPIHDWAARLILGEKIADLDVGPLPEPERFFVKELVFPFSRFPGLDPILSPRMRSIGQVFGSDDTFGKAYYKSQMAINPNIPSQGKIFLSARDEDKEAILQVSKRYLELGFSLVSTEGTAQFLAERGIEVDHVHKVSDAQPNLIDLIKNGEIALVINIPGGFQSKQDEQMIRRVTIDHKIHLFTTTSGAFLLALGIESMRKDPLTIQPCHG